MSVLLIVLDTAASCHQSIHSSCKCPEVSWSGVMKIVFQNEQYESEAQFVLLFSYYLRKKGCTYRSILSPLNKVVLAMCYCQKVCQNKCILLLLTIQNQIQNRVMKVANTCGELGKGLLISKSCKQKVRNLSGLHIEKDSKNF